MVMLGAQSIGGKKTHDFALRTEGDDKVFSQKQ